MGKHYFFRINSPYVQINSVGNRKAIDYSPTLTQKRKLSFSTTFSNDSTTSVTYAMYALTRVNVSSTSPTADFLVNNSHVYTCHFYLVIISVNFIVTLIFLAFFSCDRAGSFFSIVKQQIPKIYLTCSVLNVLKALTSKRSL